MVRQFLTILNIFIVLSNCSAKCIDNYNESDRFVPEEQQIECNVSTHLVGKSLDHFWESTGFCPPDPHDNSSDYMLSRDMYQNLALIGSLPHSGIKQIRIHFLLKLISAKKHLNQIEYNFTQLDQLLIQLKQFGLKPGFEIMGNPSNIFNDFENRTQVLEWKNLVKQIANRYIDLFGIDFVKTWNFESWNEPSIEFRNIFYDNIKVTPKGFLNFFDASSLALLEANKGLVFGGPGDHWPESTKSGPFVIDLLQHYINGTNYLSGKKSDIKLDFISLHEKGNKGQSEYIDQLEHKALSDIQKEFPSLKSIPFVENEGDPEVGWDRNRTWRADNRYAATVVQVLARRIYNYNFTNKLSLYGFDNGFLSFYPFQFTQRTLLARFQINTTQPHYTQFVRKPGFSVMGLLAKLGNNLIDFSSNATKNSTFNVIATAFKQNNNINSNFDLRPIDYSVLFVNSLDTFMSNKTNSIKFSLNFNETKMTSNDDWKWSKYNMDNTHTNPFKVWTQNNCPDFPSDLLFKEMRKQEEPFIEVNSQSLNPIQSHWTHTFDIEFPGISLIQICRKTLDFPEKIKELRAIHINSNSVLLNWLSSSVRCLKSYEIEYSKSDSNKSFTRINKNDVIFPSFQYTSLAHNQTTIGFYRIRVIDFWDRKGDYSPHLKYDGKYFNNN